MSDPYDNRPVVFVSYSYKDEKEKQQLLSHLGVVDRAGLINIWSDEQIMVGTDWEEAIDHAIAQAKMAVLLITANFLTSSFILDRVVPLLVERQKTHGLIFFPVIARSCAWQAVDWLAKMEVRPRGGKPVWGGSSTDVDETLAAIAQEIINITNNLEKQPTLETEDSHLPTPSYLPPFEEYQTTSILRVSGNSLPQTIPSRTKKIMDRSTVQQLPTIGIITALTKEYDAVKSLLDQAKEHFIPGRGAGRRYLLGQMPDVHGRAHTVVLSLADMGNNPATARATQLLEHFPTLKSIIMVGIAGGIPYPEKPDEHVRLGDVVVSNQKGVVQYDFDKETTTKITPRFPPRPPSASLLEGVRLFNQYTAWYESINRSLKSLSIRRPAENTDILYDSINPEIVIPHPEDTKRVKDRPRLFIGPIASANKLLKNPLKRDQLRNEYDVKAVEMEGSGIADAAWQHEVNYLVVRGICDYCDEYKNDTWQSYAAVAAATFTLALLGSIPAQTLETPSLPKSFTTLPLVRYILILLVSLIVIAVVWLAFDPFGSVTAIRRFNGPLYNVWPPVMPGGFNIAVAGFSLDSEATTNPDLINCGWDIGGWLARGIKEEKIQHPDIVATVWGPERVGVISGDNPEARKVSAAEFAKKSKVDVVIYGIIIGNANNYFVKPEFYVAGDGFDYGTEVAGPDQLGQQVPINLPCHDPEKNKLNNDLKGRRRVLHHVAYGLAHFYYNDYIKAFTEFNEASNETAGADLEVVHLLKGAAKMREYSDTELSIEERTQALSEAEKAFSEAFNLNPAYPRSHLGLGGIAFQQATILSPQWAKSVDQVKLREAESHYLQSLKLVNQPDLAHVYTKGNYGLGQIYMTGYNYFPCNWSGDQARTYFNNIISANQEPPSDIFWFVGKAHASLAWLAILDGDNHRATAIQSQCPYSLAFKKNQWSTIVLTECQQAIALLEQIKFNRPDDTIADCRTWMDSAATASP